MKPDEAEIACNLADETMAQLGNYPSTTDIKEVLELVSSLFVFDALSNGVKKYFYQVLCDKYPVFRPECQSQGLINPELGETSQVLGCAIAWGGTIDWGYASALNAQV